MSEPTKPIPATGNPVPQTAPPKTVDAIRAPQVGSVQVATGAPKPPAPSLTNAVNAANAKSNPRLEKLAARTKSTTDIVSPWFRCLIHGEIDSWKTTTAAHFGTPEQTRIIATRGEDQLLPIINGGYKFLQVTNAQDFADAMSHCDAIWPDWAKHPEPVLIIDDMTRARDFVLDSSKTYTTDSGLTKEYKDTRKVYGVALGEIDAIFTAVNKKPIHIILTALSKVVEGKISLEETVTPDLSPSIGNLIMSDYSFIFFLNKKKPFETRMLTSLDSEAITEYDEAQRKPVTYQRYYFARHKIPSELVKQGIIKKYEPADLRKVWNTVRSARGAVKIVGK